MNNSMNADSKFVELQADARRQFGWVIAMAILFAIFTGGLISLYFRQISKYEETAVAFKDAENKTNDLLKQQSDFQFTLAKQQEEMRRETSQIRDVQNSLEGRLEKYAGTTTKIAAILIVDFTGKDRGVEYKFDPPVKGIKNNSYTLGGINPDKTPTALLFELEDFSSESAYGVFLNPDTAGYIYPQVFPYTAFVGKSATIHFLVFNTNGAVGGSLVANPVPFKGRLFLVQSTPLKK